MLISYGLICVNIDNILWVNINYIVCVNTDNILWVNIYYILCVNIDNILWVNIDHILCVNFAISRSEDAMMMSSSHSCLGWCSRFQE